MANSPPSKDSPSLAAWWARRCFALLGAMALLILALPRDIDDIGPSFLGQFSLGRAVNYERRPPGCLKSIALAEKYFGNEVPATVASRGFWRKDIAGLFMTPGTEGSMIKLIELSVAAADDRPQSPIDELANRQPRAGYWFRAIRHSEEITLDPNRFAVCAFPAATSHETLLYVIDERGMVYRKLADRPGGLEVFPTDSELKQAWTLVAR